MVMEQDPIPPRILNRNTDHDLEMITLRCLQKPPELRYETGYDLAADLNAFLKGRTDFCSKWQGFAFVGPHVSRNSQRTCPRELGLVVDVAQSCFVDRQFCDKTFYNWPRSKVFTSIRSCGLLGWGLGLWCSGTFVGEWGRSRLSSGRLLMSGAAA